MDLIHNQQPRRTPAQTVAADWSVSPAVRRCIEGHPFLLDGGVCEVERRFASRGGIQSDVLVLAFEGPPPPGRTKRQIMPVRSLEAVVATGRIIFPPLCARSPNEPHVRIEAPSSAQPVPTRAGDQSDLLTVLRRCGEVHTVIHCRKAKCRLDHRDGPPTNPERPRGHTSDPAKGTPQGVDSACERRNTRRTFRTAICLALKSGRFRTRKQAFHALHREWRADWGTLPSYSTICRWVRIESTMHVGDLRA
jgi:hypothetical protein